MLNLPCFYGGPESTNKTLALDTHSFVFWVLQVSRGVFTWIQFATLPLGATKLYTLVL